LQNVTGASRGVKGGGRVCMCCQAGPVLCQ